MSNGFVDPNAGRYRGDDPEAARAFREIQKQLQHMREDPIYKIKSTTAIVGTYNAVQVGGRTSVDGVSAAAPHWGMGTAPAAQTVLLVNTLESPTNSASAIDLGTVLVGSRRLNGDGTDTVFVSYSVNSASSHLDKPDTDPDGDPDGGGPGIGPGGIPPITPGDPVIPLGGGLDGSCPLSKTIRYHASTNPSFDTTIIVNWNGSSWDNSATVSTDLVSAQLFFTEAGWAISGTHPDGPYSNFGLDYCPPNGTYTGTTIGTTATVS